MRLACSSGGGVLSLHDIRSGDILWEFASEAKGRILDIGFDATNRFILARMTGYGLAAWNAESGEHLGSTRGVSKARKLFIAEDRVGGMDISRDGSVLATGYFDGEVVFWDTVTWEPQLSVRTSLTPIRDVEFSPDGQTLVVGGKGGHVAVFRSEPPL